MSWRNRIAVYRDIGVVFALVTLLWACGANEALAQTTFRTSGGNLIGGNVLLKCDAGANGVTNCRAVTPSDPLPVVAAGGGQQTSANSQSVTPASDSDFAKASNQTAAGASAQKAQGADAINTTPLGNPLMAGCEATAGPPGQLSSGQVGRVRCALDRTLIIAVATNVQNSPDTANSLRMTDAFGVSGPLQVQVYNFDPATNNARVARGDGTGSWVHAPASTITGGSGTIAASGGTAAMTFTSTTDGEFVNPSTGTFWCSWGTPSVNGAGSYPVAPGGSYRPPSRVAGTWTCLSTAANQPYTFNRAG